MNYLDKQPSKIQRQFYFFEVRLGGQTPSGPGSKGGVPGAGPGLPSCDLARDLGRVCTDKPCLYQAIYRHFIATSGLRPQKILVHLKNKNKKTNREREY